MSRQFIDSIIDMKLDECDISIKEINQQIEEMERREAYLPKGSKAYRALIEEFVEAIKKRHRVEMAKKKLLKVYTKRNMEALFAEFDSVENFLRDCVVIEVKKTP